MAEDTTTPRRAGGESVTGEVVTGSYLTSEGSSVETDEDIATAEEIPSTEEILYKGKRNKGT